MANKLKAVKSKLTRQTFPQSINTCERSVIEIASKSPFTSVNRIPIWYDFRGGTKAIQYSVIIASPNMYNLSIIAGTSFAHTAAIT